MKVYTGIDIGSVTLKIAVVDEVSRVVTWSYQRTEGRPVEALKESLKKSYQCLSEQVTIAGAGATGSARYLAGAMVGADIIKNEITCQAVGTLHFVPDVQTIIEIGGQDSKIIILRDGDVIDFGMNTVCAAGTGSFLDHQAFRLGIKIEDFGKFSLLSRKPVHIAGRCTVFAESDMIHKQQLGHSAEDILSGLCRALARNFLGNVAVGKEIVSPVVFQGGVAANEGMVKAFEEELGVKIIVPPYHQVLGAIGAALLAKEEIQEKSLLTQFRGFDVCEERFETSSFECKACPSLCEIAQLSLNNKVVARWGGRCDIWERADNK